MNDSGTAGTGPLRQDGSSDLSARMARLEKSNARLKLAVVGAVMLGAGMALGGLTLKDDPVIAYTATDDTMYRVFKSGKMQYLRLQDNPARTVHGVMNWGDFRIDKNMTLPDKP
ncbi:MAG: hypothetical protein JJ974_03025 [Phycisphaerales bacterium]|nr:hypothetical protein [Phycisphaerales bacterium]